MSHPPVYPPGYPPPYPSAQPPAKPPSSGIDIALTLLFLLLALSGVAVAAFFGLFFMAFTDYCPPETCDVDAGLTAMSIGFVAAGALWLAGTAASIVLLFRRSTAWPLALGTLLLCGVASIAGIAGYLSAIGM